MISHVAVNSAKCSSKQVSSENEGQKIDEIKKEGIRKTWREGGFLRVLPSSGHGHRGRCWRLNCQDPRSRGRIGGTNQPPNE